MNSLPDVSIIIVTFNSANVIERCLDSLGNRYQAATIVFDNCSSDDTASLVRSHFPQVRLIENESNVGFGAACNSAAAISDSKYILLLNPDIQSSPNSIDSLMSLLDESHSVGIIGPKLRYDSGEVQSSFRTVQTPLLVLLRRTPLGRLWWAKSILESHLMTAAPGVLLNVDWLLGAAMLIRRSLWEKIGGFDERFFLYCEDMDLCLRAWSAGSRVVYAENIEMVHSYAQSSKGLNLTRKTTRLHFTSAIRFYLKHPKLIFNAIPRYLPSRGDSIDGDITVD